MTGLDMYQKRQWLSISSLCNFARCPRKYFYESGCRLAEPVAQPALLYGEAIHKALPELLTGDPATAPSRALVAFDSIWDDSIVDDKRNRSRVIMLFLEFLRTHGSSRVYELIDPPLASTGGIEVTDRNSQWEIPFAVDIGLDVPLVGKIDGLAKHRQSGEYYALEFKTTSENSGRFLDSFTLNPQIIGYTLVLRELTRLPVRGAILDSLYVSKINTGTITNEYVVPDFLLSDFITWARWVGSQLLACEAAGDFPKDLSACTPYPQFGQPGYKCRYMQLCQVEDWTALRDLFVLRSDTPFQIKQGPAT